MDIAMIIFLDKELMMKKLLVMLSVMALGFSANAVFADTVQNAAKSTSDAANDLGKGTVDAANKLGKGTENAIKSTGDAFDKAAQGVENMVKGN